MEKSERDAKRAGLLLWATPADPPERAPKNNHESEMKKSPFHSSPVSGLGKASRHQVKKVLRTRYWFRDIANDYRVLWTLVDLLALQATWHLHRNQGPDRAKDCHMFASFSHPIPQSERLHGLEWVVQTRAKATRGLIAPSVWSNSSTPTRAASH